MPVFKFTGLKAEREERHESGTVVARDENEAKEKLSGYAFSKVRLKPLGGISALLGRFTATVT